MTIGRRHATLLLLPVLAAGGCSVLPNRPYQEVQRFALAPERPRREPPPSGRAPVLLLRTLRAAPGLEARGLRQIEANGQVTTEFWNEWTAPPAELAEEALRRWLAASGLFAAVTPPGSRLRPDLVLEAGLVRLQAAPEAGLARAALSALLLREGAEGGSQARILGQFTPEATAPLPGGPRRVSDLPPPEAAEAMAAALATALAMLERELRAALREAGVAAARPARAPAPPARPPGRAR
jgi:cholesterol transport system auxiliary component